MTAPFRLYGADLSPYSLKVRSYLRFKGLDFEWLPRTNARQEEFARYAKQPLIPLLVDADETVLQDSTPIIERLERDYPEPSIVPADAGLAFVAALLEDYADEWLNKAMFHYRWSFADDQESASRRIIAMIFDGADAPEGAEDGVRTRMIARLHHVGSSPETAPAIEASFARAIGLFEALLGEHAYLLGDRPSIADFGLAGQFAQLLSDPTPGAMLRDRAPKLVRWLARMDQPKTEGEFASLQSLRAPLAALLHDEVADAYLPWMAANAQAVADDESTVRVELGEAMFVQRPQRYAAKAFAELRRKCALAAEDGELTELLGETGCAGFLAPPAASSESVSDHDGDAEDGEGDED